MEANFVQTSRSGSKTRRWPGKGRRKAAVSVAGGGGEERVKIIYTPTRRQEKNPTESTTEKRKCSNTATVADNKQPNFRLPLQTGCWKNAASKSKHEEEQTALRNKVNTAN